MCVHKWLTSPLNDIFSYEFSFSYETVTIPICTEENHKLAKNSNRFKLAAKIWITKPFSQNNNSYKILLKVEEHKNIPIATKLGALVTTILIYIY